MQASSFTPSSPRVSALLSALALREVERRAAVAPAARASLAQAPQTVPLPPVERVLGYLRLNLATASVSGAARAIHVSRRSLQRLLHAEHTSFRELVVRARVECAKALLLTDRPMGSISVAVGLRKPEQFRRQFRDAVGMGPKEWRRAHAGSRAVAALPRAS
ncbi:MAG: helix-turn-helix domain-containing protein [Polyangiaceae bacterium]|nr:helix-turn-helix domain-containing protein [Polyangiaceae bacterium]